jgi:hypothetical protein
VVLIKLSLVLILLLNGCSRKTVSNQEISSKPQEKKRTTIDGPTAISKKAPFRDATETWGLEKIKALRLYAVDWDDDGDTDLVTLNSYYDHPKFYRFDSKLKKFIPVLQTPIKHDMRASFLSFVDLNKDGLLDLIAVTLNQKSELTPRPIEIYEGMKIDGKVVYRHKFSFPTPMPTSSLGIADINMDGLLDLYIGNWFSFKKGENALTSPDRIFFGQGKGFSFKDSSYLIEEVGIKKDDKFINALPTFGVSVCDMDQNGFPDILTASSSRFKNRMWMNLSSAEGPEKRRFLDRGEVSGVAYDREKTFGKNHGGNSFYLNCADYNNDGIIDLALGELFYAFDEESQDRSSILTGSTLDFPPKFIRTEYHKDDGSGRWGQGDRNALWKDLSGDGLLDLIIENSGIPPYSRLIFFEQEKDHSFTDRAKNYGLDLLNPSGIITADIDNDGDLDLISGQSTLRDNKIKPRLYAFENLHKNRAIKIYLRAKRSNIRGLGSTVVLKTNLRSQRRINHVIAGSTPSQAEDGLVFNLKKGETPTNLTIRWPYLVKPSKQRAYPLSQTYKFKTKFQNYPATFTACDNGRLYIGKRRKCP